MKKNIHYYLNSKRCILQGWFILRLVYFKVYTLYMVHFIVLQNKSAELVVLLLVVKGKGTILNLPKIRTIACADGETRKQLVNFNINRSFLLF